MEFLLKLDFFTLLFAAYGDDDRKKREFEEDIRRKQREREQEQRREREERERREQERRRNEDW